MTRTERIKKYILGHTPRICTERARIYTQECLRREGIPIVVRRAEAFARTLREMTVYIGDDDLLLGNSSSEPLAVSLFPEYAVDWTGQELDTFAERPRQRFISSAEDRAWIREMCGLWEGSTHFDRVDHSLR